MPFLPVGVDRLRGIQFVEEINRVECKVNEHSLDELIPEVVDENEVNGRTLKTFPWLFFASWVHREAGSHSSCIS